MSAPADATGAERRLIAPTVLGSARGYPTVLAILAAAALLSGAAETLETHDLARFVLVAAAPLLVVAVLDRSHRRLGAASSQPPLENRRVPMPISTLDPRTALVLIDLQRGIAGAGGTPHPAAEVVARGARLAEAFRAHGAPVVLVRVSFAADGADAPPGRTETGRGGQRPDGWDEIVDELAGHPQDVVVTKRNWGAFHGTDLDVRLRRRGVTQIVLGGIATSLGVESTARAAHEHGYHVVLATDAMTDLDAEQHRNSVERIFPRLGERGTTGEIVELLARTRG
ncbi:hydrolase [Saccharopolyspora sp. MS10]|uniref:hydrolase n=1 Tax=Saccharopolyspora sp. MS10 TaxID=3385973 RepID=UPI0039A3DE73